MYNGIHASFVSIQVIVSLEMFEIVLRDNQKQGAMLDVDTEPARVAAPGGASPAERRVM